MKARKHSRCGLPGGFFRTAVLLPAAVLAGVLFVACVSESASGSRAPVVDPGVAPTAEKSLVERKGVETALRAPTKKQEAKGREAKAKVASAAKDKGAVESSKVPPSGQPRVGVPIAPPVTSEPVKQEGILPSPEASQLPSEQRPPTSQTDPVPSAATASDSPASAPEVAPSSQPVSAVRPSTAAAPNPVTDVQPSPAPTPVPTAVPAPKAVERISGRMNIDFGSRRDTEKDGRPKEGAVDSYALSILLSDSLKLSGTIKRQPRLLSSVLGRELQAGELIYDVNILALKPGQSDAKIGRIEGKIPIDKQGRYLLNPAAGGTLRVVGSDGLSTTFDGVIVGKNVEQRVKVGEKLRQYVRSIAGRTVKVESLHIDPLEFQKVLLPPGPVAVYRSAIATGNLDYDYDTGNWYTSGLTFSDGKNRDVVSGSIKWEEDARRDLNGRGKYSFNLRWNEEAHRGAVDESAYFQSAADEDLFFAVETGIPTLSGTISYEDTFGPPVGGEQGPVVASKITYDLRAEEVSKPQLLQFLKLWLLIVGPVNDE